ncbi:MAG: hypothetical protein PHE83_18490 [Opitutaceae bacterium]|nr:hypothetical protein [Opitutaceae bacterium]
MTPEALLENIPPIARRQQLIDLSGTGRSTHRLIVRFKRGQHSLTAFYERDLAISGQIGPCKFKDLPLNDAYILLLKAYIPEADRALRQDDPEALCREVCQLFRRYCAFGRELHHLAAHSVCNDGSRLTTALTLANNYLFTIIHLSRRLLGDNLGPNADNEIAIDTHYAGLESWDGLGMSWGYDPQPTISFVQRTDLSKGSDFSVKAGARLDDPRIQALIALCHAGPPTQGSQVPDGPNSVSARVSLYYPLADAFRATPASMALVMAGAVSAFKAAALEDFGEP